ncbi:hypothetical protein MHD_00010 [Mannheimia granulomatis]|uniref:Uncharacterized protein n=1 Tax=Mannheimia granulomatis TaxID=85402 RepID=A0A011LY42_9PAST|nr:hypothetical protein AK33_06735 [Mannheimia granulomatis]RGE49228.1 hypothetical protein MHD_00010 [Mannheimia granulomatis]
MPNAYMKMVMYLKPLVGFIVIIDLKTVLSIINIGSKYKE